MEENRNTYTIHGDGKIGEVQIADDVVAIIAGLAATNQRAFSKQNANKQSISFVHLQLMHYICR